MRASRSPRRSALRVAIVAAALLVATLAWQARQSTAAARIAATMKVKDEGRLHLVRSSGSILYDEGAARGTLPGTVQIRFLYDGAPNVSAQITISSHAGTIQARGTARLSNPTSASPSFSGTLTIASGAGRYRHASGSGRFYGVFYRRSYAITVHTEGTLRY